MPSHHHRSGGLRQSNKRHKQSKASKRSITRAAGGKISGDGGRFLSIKKSGARSNKADRRHMMQQKREASRQALLKRKRLGGSADLVPPPRIVGIISLGESLETEEQLRSLLLQGADDKIIKDEYESSTTSVTAKYNVHKKDGTVTYLTNSTAFCSQDGNDAVLGALDMCRVCDMILFVIDGNGPEEKEQVLGMNIGGGSVTTKGSKKSASNQTWDHLISERGDRILTAVKAQGLPTPLTILAHTAKTDGEDYTTMQSAKSVRRSAHKRRMDLKRYVSRFATTEFGQDHDKVVEVDLATLDDDDENAMEDDDLVDPTTTAHSTSSSATAASAALVRTICNMSASPPKWVADAPRSYLVADGGCRYDAENEELSLIGFVRGHVPFDVNALLHIPNLGTYACKSVQKVSHPLFQRKDDAKKMDEDDTAQLLSDPTKRESLDMFPTPDALEGEQNLIGFDENMHDVDFEDDESQEGVSRPAGWSDYQSAWLDAVDHDAADDEDEMDHGELAKALNQKPTSSSGASVMTSGGMMDLDDHDHEISAAEHKTLVEQRRRKDQKEELEFPDEVEVKEDENARDRYARYRSLKSFRKSHWDPKENLPESYGSVYHFSSFKATQRDVMADIKDIIHAANDCRGEFWGRKSDVMAKYQHQNMEEDSTDVDEDILEGCIPTGSYVTIVVEKIPIASYARLSSKALITAVTLLPHENKVSVLHMGLSQSTKCNEQDVPIKSKDVLTFRCGWRTWKARPVFSQNNLNSDKHKFERFLPQEGAFFAASVFGPVTYSPCPVMVFHESSASSSDTPLQAADGSAVASSNHQDLIAIGSMLGADADRIVVKRVVLTGYPVRVHKRHATVKYMFYNPDDVKWFKPAGLYTKHGLHGNIIESVGEHGTMKCLFNAPIKQHDTVCLPLYKRIYPKFVSDQDGSLSNSKSSLVVL